MQTIVIVNFTGIAKERYLSLDTLFNGLWNNLVAICHDYHLCSNENSVLLLTVLFR